MNDKVKEFVVEKVQDWETGSNEFFGHWNDWAIDYEMKYVDGEKLPKGVSKNVSAETPRSVNTLASTMTAIQIGQDPPFELRAKYPGVDEQKMFDMEGRIREMLIETEFERFLTKGNRSLFLFGSQIFEKTLMNKMGYEGTALRPLSLLQCAFNTECYMMDDSEHMTPVIKITADNLRALAYRKKDFLNLELVEKAIKEKSDQSGQNGFAEGSIDARRQRAGYSMVDKNKHELILYSGRANEEIINMPEFAEMWAKFQKMEDPLLSDVTIWVLDRKYVLGWYPTPYGSWKYLYCIGHDIEFELEPYAHGVGSFCHGIQKDMNRLLRYGFDTAKFNVFSMFFAGKGSGLKSNYMNIVPFSAIPCDDSSQIVPIKPNVDGIGHMMKLLEFDREESRAVSNATSSLQATPTGVTATENNLLMDAALRALKSAARINNTSVVRSYYQTLMRNLLDQNPYDSNLVDVDMIPVLPSDREFGTQEVEMLLKFGMEMISVRSNAPIDFNPLPIFQKAARKLGIPPRELSQPRPQVDRMLDVLRRLNPGGQPNEVQGEIAGAGRPDANIPGTVNAIPTSPLGLP